MAVSVHVKLDGKTKHLHPSIKSNVNKNDFKCALGTETAVCVYLFTACVPASIASAQAAALFWPAVRCPAAAVKNRLYSWNRNKEESMAVCLCVCLWVVNIM